MIKKDSIKKARQRANRKTNETEHEFLIRKKNEADRGAERSKKETHEKLIGDSLLDVFEAEKDIQVPNISDSIEVEIATKKA
jgi:hypothetical protein